MSTAGASRRVADANWARAWRTPHGSIWILAALPALWSAIAWLTCGDDPMYTAWRAGAGIPDLIKSGQYWRLITASLLHVDSWHLAINSLSILVLAQIVQRVFGAPRTWIIFLITAWIATLGSALVGDAWTVGASGGVFGLIGAPIGLAARAWREFPRTWTRSGQAVAIPWLLAVALAIVLAIMGEGDRTAHLVGLSAGALLGFVLKVLPLGAKPAPPAIRKSLGVIAAISGAALLGTLALPVSFGPAQRVQTQPISFEVPNHWISGGPIPPCETTVTDGLRFVCTTVYPRAASESVGRVLDHLARDAELTMIAPLSDPIPSGWSGFQMQTSLRPDAAYQIYAQRAPSAWWVVTIYAPAQHLHGAPDIPALLNSVSPLDM